MTKLLLDPDTHFALETSIAHWQRYAEGHGAFEGRPEASNCALCQKFFDNDCKGCPVASTTGHLFCLDTPFEDADKALTNSHYNYTDIEFLIAAQAELDFLQSILDNSTLVEL